MTSNPILLRRRAIATDHRWLVDAFPAPPSSATVAALVYATGRSEREVRRSLRVLWREDFIARSWYDWRRWPWQEARWFMVNPYFL